MIKFTLVLGLYREEKGRYSPMYFETDIAQTVNSP